VKEFSGGNRAVAEYLLAEMLECQSSDVQRMLLRTSLVPRLNGELADVLAATTGSERVLLELEDANAFVISTDPQRTWFRYHQLLGEFLRLELRRTLADEVPELHRRAAAWFADHGHAADAIRHLLAAGDWPEAARLLADHALTLALDGREEIGSLLASFPSATPEVAGDLALAYLVDELARGHLEEASAHLAVAESRVEGTPSERRPRIETVLAFSRLTLARQQGRFSEVVGEVERLSSAPSAESSALAQSGEFRGAALMHLGIAQMWSGRLDAAELNLVRGAEIARKIDRPYLELACRAHLGFASISGSFSAARNRCREAITLAEHHGWSEHPLLAPALGTLACTSIWMADLDDGETWLRGARHAVEGGNDPASSVLVHLATGMLYAARAEHERSLQELRLADEAQSQLQGQHALASQVSSWTASAHARLGHPDLASAFLARRSSQSIEASEIQPARAAISLAEGDAAAALEQAQTVPDAPSTAFHASAIIEARLLAGLAALELGLRAEASRQVEAALAAAEPDRLMLAFLVTDSSRLLDLVRPADTAHGAMLIDVRELLGGGAPGISSREGSPTSPEPLSPSELRVLRYLPTNLTRPEIARELYVSTNTISTHIRSIYSKLGANGRSAAVEHARALKLLAGSRAH
jgi:LuxR family maltose regulon positive regulatory protein